METTLTTTREVIASMLTENTGQHFLDSGGAYGRHWQRSQGMEVEHFEAAPRAWVDKWGGVTIDLFHYLTERLEHFPALEAEYLAYVEALGEGGYSDFQNMEAFAEDFGDIEGCYLGGSFNSYNFDGEAISQTIQGIRFNYGEETVVLLQIHGGADVRGGYTRPRAFKVTGEVFPYDSYEYQLLCPTNHEHSLSWRCEWITYEGSALKWDQGPQWDETRECLPCLECGAPLEAVAPEAY